jgi:hypothetical protein
MIFQRGNGGICELRSELNELRSALEKRERTGHRREERTSASVGAAWIHVAEPKQPHIQNDAAVDLAMPLIVCGPASITMSDRRYSLCRPRPYVSVKLCKVSFSLTSYK